MKNKTISLIAFAGLFVAQLGHAQGTMADAQGTTYLSNLGQVSSGSLVLGSDAWIAQSFYTGTSPDGYYLNSVQLLTVPAVGSPSGFAVSLYTHSSADGRFPGNTLGSLTGPDPTAGGVFSYESAGILLSPRTGYFLVLTAATPTANGAFSWSLGSFFGADSSDGWGMENFHYSSTDCTKWDRVIGPNFQFGVTASTVPEPSSWLLMALGLVGFGLWRHPFKR